MNSEKNLVVNQHIHHECHCNQCLTLIEAGINESPDEHISFIRKIISAGVLRFAGWWSVFAGLLALNSVCPVCGSTACPVGIGTTGIIAAFFAVIKQWGGGTLKKISQRIRILSGREYNLSVEDKK